MNKTSLLACVISLLLFSCGDGQKRFKLEGSIKGINQGELYVYGINGSCKLDTIGVSRGDFTYQASITEPTTLFVVFPNYSEIPVFAEPGVSVYIKGDATHLKETEVKGTETNKQMTAFRLKTNTLLPPEILKEATRFINEKPESPISLYLLNRFFVQVPTPDYVKVKKLAKIIHEAQPNNSQLSKILNKVDGLKALTTGSKMPLFNAVDLNGEAVSMADLNSKANVITLWASWNYEGISILNLLSRLQKEHPGQLKVLGISVDGNVKDCKQIVERDSITWHTICDGKMWDTPVLQKIGLSYLPDNVVINGQGKIVGRSLNYQELNKKIEELIE